jgi:hypothetical protein
MTDNIVLAERILPTVVLNKEGHIAIPRLPSPEWDFRIQTILPNDQKD